ncbi:MAG: GMC family oxidoreductase, partial [Actinomycetes bacterium]
MRPALERRNLTVVTGAQVTRVLFDGRRATGVAYRTGDGDHRAPAEREVVLCGGVVNSPQLLMLSGVGPAEHLRSLGIHLVHDLPGVGGNVQDHLAVPTVVTAPGVHAPVSASSVPSLLRLLLLRSGPLTGNASEACAFVRTHPQLAAPDVELIFAPAASLAAALPSARARLRGRLGGLRRLADRGRRPPAATAVTIGAALLTPRSAGTIRLRSGDWRDAPAIDPGYLSDPDGHDVQLLAHATRLAVGVAHAGGFRLPVGDRRAPPSGPDVDDDALEAWIRDRALTLNHPVGSCRMGTDPMAVVDPQLRVHGVEHLRVVDASV